MQLKATVLSRMVFLCLVARTTGILAFGAPCRVELKAYNGYGDPQHIVIARLSRIGKNLDVLSMPNIARVDSKNRNILIFGKDNEALAGQWELLLDVKSPANAKGSKIIKQKVTARITSCPQRVSIVVQPFLYGPFDMAGISVRGKVSGCKIIGDWWVRVAPMFGSDGTVATVEATITTDGTFDASGFMAGQRALVTIGRGKDLVKVIAADIYEGKLNDLGVLDLGSVCPR